MGKLLKFPVKFNKEKEEFDFIGLTPLQTERLYEIMTFLSENKDDMKKKFGMHIDLFLREYGVIVSMQGFQFAFEDFIQGLVKEEVINHFMHYTPEDIVLLTDTAILKAITHNGFFNLESYVK